MTGFQAEPCRKVRNRMTTEKIEVLAPAGNPAALKAAVFAGADAVYMGGALFSARANAANFSREEMREAVRFARERSVRVYVTVNTLLKDGELSEALDFCRYLCELPVDGILVQDMGLFALLREACPEMPLHASTQMSLHTPAGAALLKALGASRVVLAREMSLQEIREVSARTDVELEAFVHGALCMSLSGQCYFSAMLGGRSGNRGRCAQTCRLPFSAPGGTGHDLSLKDMSFIGQIGALRGAGVCSAKIEGRMKRPEYVAAAVSACRHAADGESVPQDLLEDLGAVFSRSGFTDGYLSAHRGRDMFGIRTKEDVESTSDEVFASLHELYKNEMQRVPVTFALSAFAGQSPSLTVSDGTHSVDVADEGHVCEAALRLPVDTERWHAQLKKTGGTPYRCAEVQVHTDGKTAVPVSVLNGLRRSALEALGAQRREKPPVPFQTPVLDVRPHRAEKLRLRGWFRDAAQLPENAAELEKIILPLDTPPDVLDTLRGKGHDLILEIPRALWGIEAQVRETMQRRRDAGFTHFRCGNLGAVALCRELQVSAHGGFSLNVFNTQSAAFFEKLGLEDTEFSFELTGEETAGIGGALPRGALVYGRQPLMLTRNCPLANSPRGCLNCRRPGTIRDRRGVAFPVLCTRFSGKPVFSEVFNSVPLTLSDKLRGSINADFGVLRFSVENNVETGEIIRDFIRQEKPHSDYTRGLFTRGVL